MARLKGFQKLTPIDEALKTFQENVQIKKLGTESSQVYSALNRVLQEDIVAEEDLPRFDRSAVDGYAVKAEDTFEATQFKPKTLLIIRDKEIVAKQAKPIWTGNPIPKGADAVVMLENTRGLDDRIDVWTPLTPGENVSKRGEDLRKGQVAVSAGTRLRPHHLGLIAALGIAEFSVTKKPKVAILATGDELAKLGGQLQENQVFEVNKLVLSAMCAELDAEPIDLGIAKDDVEDIVNKLKTGFGADMIITTGGTSVGAPDLVPEAIEKIEKRGVIVHGIAMRPAMPTALAVAHGKPTIVLSGNPVAAMMGFEVFARPLICRMLGMKQEEPRPIVNVRMARKVTTALGRRTFVRVRVFNRRGEFSAEPVSARGSGTISTMTQANGYVVVPENREGLAEGEPVSVHLFDVVETIEGNV